MIAPPGSVRATPSLCVEEVAVRSYRSFRDRVVVPLRAGRAPVEKVVPLHGGSGTGKSSFTAALGLFFAAGRACLAAPGCHHVVPATDFGMVSARDRIGIDDPTEIDVRFADPRFTPLRLTIAPAGRDLRCALTYLPQTEAIGPGQTWPAERLAVPNEEYREWLRVWFTEPLGLGSRPIAYMPAEALLSACRKGVGGPVPMVPFADELYAIRTSLDPAVRDRWYRFVVAVRCLPPFEHKEVSVERLDPAAGPEILIEDRGRSVLRFHELSAGEREILTLAAFAFLAQAAILVIDRPESHLDRGLEAALQALLQRRIDAGRLDQVFLETSSKTFDAPTILQFSRRDDGSSDAARGPAVGEAPADVEKKSREQGAKQGWVTREGYTQLPEAMREELRLQVGGQIFFLKGRTRWEAWPGADLERMFPAEDTDDSGVR